MHHFELRLLAPHMNLIDRESGIFGMAIKPTGHMHFRFSLGPLDAVSSIKSSFPGSDNIQRAMALNPTHWPISLSVLMALLASFILRLKNSLVSLKPSL